MFVLLTKKRALHFFIFPPFLLPTAFSTFALCAALASSLALSRSKDAVEGFSPIFFFLKGLFSSFESDSGSTTAPYHFGRGGWAVVWSSTKPSSPRGANASSFFFLLEAAQWH